MNDLVDAFPLWRAEQNHVEAVQWLQTQISQKDLKEFWLRWNGKTPLKAVARKPVEPPQQEAA